MTRDSGTLGGLLIEEGLLTQDALEKGLSMAAETSRPLGRVLVEEGIVGEADLVRTLAKHIGVEFVELGGLTIDPAAASLIPEFLLVATRPYQSGSRAKNSSSLSAIRPMSWPSTTSGRSRVATSSPRSPRRPMSSKPSRRSRASTTRLPTSISTTMSKRRASPRSKQRPMKLRSSSW